MRTRASRKQLRHQRRCPYCGPEPGGDPDWPAYCAFCRSRGYLLVVVRRLGRYRDELEVSVPKQHPDPDLRMPKWVPGA